MTIVNIRLRVLAAGFWAALVLVGTFGLIHTQNVIIFRNTRVLYHLVFWWNFVLAMQLFGMWATSDRSSYRDFVEQLPRFSRMRVHIHRFFAFILAPIAFSSVTLGVVLPPLVFFVFEGSSGLEIVIVYLCLAASLIGLIYVSANREFILPNQLEEILDHRKIEAAPHEHDAEAIERSRSWKSWKRLRKFLVPPLLAIGLFFVSTVFGKLIEDFFYVPLIKPVICQIFAAACS